MRHPLTHDTKTSGMSSEQRVFIVPLTKGAGIARLGSNLKRPFLRRIYLLIHLLEGPTFWGRRQVLWGSSLGPES